MNEQINKTDNTTFKVYKITVMQEILEIDSHKL